MKLKPGLKTFLRYACLYLLYLILQFVISIPFPMSPELQALMAKSGTDEAFIALIIISLINTLIINFAVSRSKWHGLKLIGAMLLVTTGFQVFLMQIDTVVFINAFPLMTPAVFFNTVMIDLVPLLIYVPMAVLVLGKIKRPAMAAENGPQAKIAGKAWFWRVPLLALLYVFLYFLFGIFPISFPEVKAFYASWIPAFDPSLLMVVAYLRGLLWVFISMPLLFMMKGSKGESTVALALLISLLPITTLMAPNPMMPSMPRLAHFIEILLSNGLLGVAIGTFLQKPANGKSISESVPEHVTIS